MYQDNIEKQQKTENIENFITSNDWQQLNEKDRNALLQYIKEKQITTVEGFKIPLGPISFNSIFGYKFLPLFTAIFCVLVISSPLISNDISLHLFGVTLPSSLFSFTLAYLFLDLINEVYGFKQARIAVYSACLLSFIIGGIIQINGIVPHTLYFPSFAGDSQKFVSHYLSLSNRMYITGINILIADLINVFIFQTLKSLMT